MHKKCSNQFKVKVEDKLLIKINHHFQSLAPNEHTKILSHCTFLKTPQYVEEKFPFKIDIFHSQQPNKPWKASGAPPHSRHKVPHNRIKAMMDGI